MTRTVVIRCDKNHCCVRLELSDAQRVMAVSCPALNEFDDKCTILAPLWAEIAEDLAEAALRVKKRWEELALLLRAEEHQVCQFRRDVVVAREIADEISRLAEATSGCADAADG